jgi:O-methyltransferase
MAGSQDSADRTSGPALARRVARALVPQRLRPSRPSGSRIIPEPLEEAFVRSEVTPLNLYFLNECVERIGRLRIQGDIVESGVYQGGSAAVLGWAMMRLGDGPRKLWLFDSFAGFPGAGDRDGEFSHTLEGEYVGSEEGVRRLLAQAGVPGERYQIAAGFFEDTFPAVEAPRTALLHIDCDLYKSVKLTLEKFIPAVVPGGFVVVNDYGIYKGAKAATDEYLQAQGLDVELVALDPTASFFQKPGDGFSGLPVAGHYSGWPGAVA